MILLKLNEFFCNRSQGELIKRFCHARPLANGLSGIHLSKKVWIPAKNMRE